MSKVLDFNGLEHYDEKIKDYIDEHGGGSSYTFTNGLTESGGTVSWDLNDRIIKATNGTGVCIGSSCTAENSNYTSLAHGRGCHADKDGAHAEGFTTTASGSYSHAEGDRCYATTSYAHAEGRQTYAEGLYSHSEGRETHANNQQSHAEGYGTIASSDNQHVQGKYNIEDSSSTYAFIIGNGTSDSARSNALTVDWSGNITAAGLSDGTTTKTMTEVLAGGGGTEVSGTNDGTNWTSITIDDNTYAIPSGGDESVFIVEPNVTLYVDADAAWHAGKILYLAPKGGSSAYICQRNAGSEMYFVQFRGNNEYTRVWHLYGGATGIWDAATSVNLTPPAAETWTFTLDDDTTVTKEVAIWTSQQ